MPVGTRVGENVASVLLVIGEKADEYGAALREQGFDVAVCADTIEALKRIEEGAPADVLVTDVVFRGGLNGFALARMAILRRPALRFVYLLDQPDDAPPSEREAALGALLTQPLTPALLVASVRGALR